MAGSSAGQHVAIDGKTIRRSFDRANKRSGVHMVSAWVQANHAVFGQVKVDEKSNEITAIPKLIAVLELQGATVTIDAMGCQEEIAKQIVEEKGGDYILAVKGNHGTLHADVKLYMDDAVERDFARIEHKQEVQTEKGHGRIETRQVWATSEIEWLKKRHNWAGIRSLVLVESTRKIGDAISAERRYFISSLAADKVRWIAQCVRNHWSVENQLHWCLDVSFGEDNSRARMGYSAENLSRLRRLALMLLKQEKTAKVGIKSKRHNAGWDEQYLLKVLKI